MNNHAIVIGGSMAGLLAARVLSEYFEQVTIVERDQLPVGPDSRKGVPHDRHFHILLAKGFELLDVLFPGISQDLTEAGATPLELGIDGRWLFAAGWAPISDLGVNTLICSRPLLEWAVRQRVAAQPNVTFTEQTEVQELMSDAAKTTITGIRIRSRKHDDSTMNEISADLVVDASGRTSHLPEWLAALGYPAPSQTSINPFLGYATRYYKRPEHFSVDWKSIYIFADPPKIPRAGALFPLEGDRWIVTVGGAAKDYPPTDEVGFMDYVRSLRDPIIYDLIKNATPLTSISGYQKTANQLRHYEKMTHFPENLIALGDAVCAFNPIYGQGMTTAALGAMVLRRELAKTGVNRVGFWRKFQPALARSNVDPWLLATSTDLLYPTTEGAQVNALISFQQWYVNALMPVGLQGGSLNKDFAQVLHLMKPPLTLFKPRYIAQLLWHLIIKRRQIQPSIRPNFFVKPSI
jgi:2-polyprenyl-6-methoxyphenol hydroxylase-like FAD-dependent oxidoreductase